MPESLHKECEVDVAFAEFAGAKLYERGEKHSERDVIRIGPRFLNEPEFRENSWTHLLEE